MRNKIGFVVLFAIFGHVLHAQNWERMPGPVGTSVNALVKYAGKIYAGTDGGIFYSEDQGVSWVPDLDGMDGGRLISSLCVKGDRMVAATTYGIYCKIGQGPWQLSDRQDLTVKVISNDNVFLAIDYWFWIWRSTDGLSWDLVNAITGQVAGTNGNTLFVGGSGGDELHRSVDDGLTWQLVHTQQGGYQSIEGNGSVLLASTPIGGMLRSTDNGQSFNPAMNGFPPMGTPFLAYELTMRDNLVYASLQHDPMQIYYSIDAGLNWQPRNPGLHPSIYATGGYLLEEEFQLAGTHQGLYRSTNGGESWSFDASNGLANCVFNGLLQNGGKLHALTGYNLGNGSFGFYQSENNGISWSLPNNYPFGNNANLVTGATVNGVLLVSQGGSTLSRSTDNGQSWSNVLGYDFGIQKALHVQGSRVLMATNFNGIWYSDDNGITWTQATTPWNVTYSMTSMAGVLYAGSNFHPWRSLDNGATWVRCRKSFQGLMTWSR